MGMAAMCLRTPSGQRALNRGAEWARERGVGARGMAWRRGTEGGREGREGQVEDGREGREEGGVGGEGAVAQVASPVRPEPGLDAKDLTGRLL